MADIFDTLAATISAERLSTYLTAAGHDRDRALKRYMWNAQIGEAFHVPIQAVEVGLRNFINKALIVEFGIDWWKEPRLTGHSDDERSASEIALLRNRIWHHEPIIKRDLS